MVSAVVGSGCCVRWENTPHTIPLTPIPLRALSTQPCSYSAKQFQDNGSEKTIQVNEGRDFSKSIAKGKKPATGIRFNGVKYFSVGPNPTKVNGYSLWKCKGPGASLSIAVTKQCIVVARSSQSEGHVQAEMTSHVEVVADYLYKAGY